MVCPDFAVALLGKCDTMSNLMSCANGPVHLNAYWKGFKALIRGWWTIEAVEPISLSRLRR